MHTLHCETLDALDAAIVAAGPDALFRGQVDHFPRDDGSPSLTTSFARHGCVPDLMIKWYHYARRVLKRHVQGWDGATDMATDQAILQHYGWISFYLDATGNARVGAWFASHQFIANNHCELVEDCFEDPVFLVSKAATFEPVTGIGNLYVLSRKKLRSAGLGAVHLSEIATAQGTPRYVRQDAYMVGPVAHAGLSIDFITHHITAPAHVLAAYAQGLSTSFLFPEPSDDPVFGELLAMPWEKIGRSDGPIDFFRRALDLPEYAPHIVKHMPPTTAMYRPFWLVDTPRDPNDPAVVVHVLCGSALFHGSSELSFSLPNISKLLMSHDGLMVEPDGLVYHGMGVLYGKGIIVMRKENGLVQVSEFGVEHPGLQIHGVGKFPGMHYRVDAVGLWHRATQPDDCDCGSDSHDDHIRLLGRVDAGLKEGFIVLDSPRVYLQQGMARASDAAALRAISDS